MRIRTTGAYIFLALTGIALLIFSCTKEADIIGLNIQPPGDEMGLSITDTIGLVSYSVREDSVNTSNLPISLLGSLFDPVFGKTTASIYSEIRLSNVQLDFGAGAAIDSIVLSLAFKSLWGDSSTIQTFRVFEMTENIEVDSTYYSTHVFDFNESTELGSISISPPTDSIMVDTVKLAPHLRIPLNQVLADKLLDGSSDDFVSNEEFRKFLKGLYITADPVQESGKGALITFEMFTSLTNLTVYYHNNDKDSLKYIFYITNDGARFNHFEHYDYADADPLFRQQVIDGNKALGQDIIYLQPLGGVRTYLHIPSLVTLGNEIQSGQRTMIAVNEAKIVFSNFESDPFLDPPTRLLLANITDEKGSTTFLDDQREGDNYFGGYYNKSNMTYTFRLNRYVQDRLLNPEEEDFGLALLVPGASSVPQRVILNGSAAGSGEIKLVIKYTEVR
jgi:hypothetical protein